VIAGLIFIKPRKRVSRFGAAGLLLVIVSIALGICRETGAIIREPWRISDMFELGQGEQGVERRLIEFKDSGYQLIAVWDEMKNGVIERVLMLGGLTQFIWNRDNSLLKYRDERYSYYNYATATALLTAKNPPENALFIGLGGGLIPFQVKRIFPEIKMSAYELDPEVERVARLHLPLSELPNVRVRIGDGRQLLNEEANATTRGWDMILIDTFLNAYVPFHLTTREFFKLAYDRAAPGGLVVCDTHSIFQSTGLLEKFEATISSVFDETYALSLNSGSTLLLAFKRSVEESSSGILEGRLKRPCQVGEICKYLADIKQTLGTDRLRNLSQLAQRHDLYLTDDRNDTEIRLYKTRASLFIERPL
jgi:spermidine synthase